MEQLVILVSGAIAIWITQQNNKNLKRYACFVGIIGQPYWLEATYAAEQWGMFALSVFYTASWILGIYNNWIKTSQPTIDS